MPSILAYYNSVEDHYKTFSHTGSISGASNIDNLAVRSPSEYYQFTQGSSTTSTLVADATGLGSRPAKLVAILGAVNLQLHEITRIRALIGASVTYDSDSSPFTAIQRIRLDGYSLKNYDFFFILPSEVAAYKFEITIKRLTVSSGHEDVKLGTLYISETIEASSQLDNFDIGGVDLSVKTVSDGGQVYSDKKSVLDKMSFSVITNEKNTWGSTFPNACINHMRKTAGTVRSVIYMYYRDGSAYTNKSIYGTLDKIGTTRLLKALDRADFVKGHWWTTQINITEEL
ncbi:MAG: hypothetical protein DWP95_10450 [Proteobacteria bacterium]|nr:MAG: hypothetical protein DWP95_10450 [Pseudomonadota bacterium]